MPERMTADYQAVCALYAIEQRADGVRSFMGSDGFWYYAHMDTFGRIDKERVMTEEGADAKVAGKRPNKGSGKGTGDKGHQNG